LTAYCINSILTDSKITMYSDKDIENLCVIIEEYRLALEEAETKVNRLSILLNEKKVQESNESDSAYIVQVYR